MTLTIQKKADFKANVHSWHVGTHKTYTRHSLAWSAVTNPKNRNFSQWYLKRFSMGWIDVTLPNKLDAQTLFLSYSTQVARIYHQYNYALIDAKYRQYSHTTTKHLNELGRAAHDAGMYFQYVSNIHEPCGDENAAYLTALLNEQIEHMRNTRKRPVNRLGAYREFERIIKDIQALAVKFGGWTPAGAVMLAGAMREGHTWRESPEAAIQVAKCALDGIFL